MDKLVDKQSGRAMDWALRHFLLAGSGLIGRDKINFETLLMELQQAIKRGDTCISLGAQEQALLLRSCWFNGEQKKPLVMECNKLYFYRHWHYENILAEKILRYSAYKRDKALLFGLLERYFPVTNADATIQRDVLAKVLQQSFSVISGGPGTGKTTLVVKLLAMELELANRSLKIALVAPTGKAAVRLQYAINENRVGLPCDEKIQLAIPQEVTTIHRLLGFRYGSSLFTHNKANPIDCDLLVIDEASMIDLSLMTKLVTALTAQTRVVLVGDKDQLSSVETGSVLADLSASTSVTACELLKTYRFNTQIKALAVLVNQQRASEAWAMLMDPAIEAVNCMDADYMDFITQKYHCFFRAIADKKTVSQLFEKLADFVVLCTNKRGPKSVEAINLGVEQRLRDNNIILQPEQWYVGRPVLIHENDAVLGIFNGDVGICLPDPEQNKQLMVCFEQSNGDIKKILPSRLPKCQTAFSLTVHKSQGSQYRGVMLVLPESYNPILTKEVVYTAVTRARDKVWVVADKDVLTQAIKVKIGRQGGLREKLRVN
ncbi:MAG TPA: exodeoxyribonuclease V subunit alpha [Methylococcaceae bacterium]|jgi:exodeoxyribonuclease V alpha subunit|nr:exodeoxyribonuclease V subunit alpha [Methylococcaceae bacterium]HIN67926.1 exodeoxyribonuclease V subunit alpha [Methylococcales bacterium]HIA45380.1 exodeoxyribonuclease V subunit alpha [Methylococcaceae bacterium]HIB61751.1 exodeoxyribonuclease V subunit alpha [Methylococcaceae bacterium]HIO12454.1 exodeoxyribonuclease V subunit alpha [Methylococcales bacterium]